MKDSPKADLRTVANFISKDKNKTAWLIDYKSTEKNNNYGRRKSLIN